MAAYHQAFSTCRKWGVSSDCLPKSRSTRALDAEAPLPYYLAVGARVCRPVRCGEPLRVGDVDLPADSVLLRLRRSQDAHFHV
jgi:predicted homoserine dehydrogenase-like protein